MPRDLGVPARDGEAVEVAEGRGALAEHAADEIGGRVPHRDLDPRPQQAVEARRQAEALDRVADRLTGRHGGRDPLERRLQLGRLDRFLPARLTAAVRGPLADERQAEASGHPLDRRVAGEDELGPALGDRPGEGNGPDPAADAVAGLEDGHLGPPGAQGVGRGEAGEAGPDDRHAPHRFLWPRATGMRENLSARARAREDSGDRVRTSLVVGRVLQARTCRVAPPKGASGGTSGASAPGQIGPRGPTRTLSARARQLTPQAPAKERFG